MVGLVVTSYFRLGEFMSGKFGLCDIKSD